MSLKSWIALPMGETVSARAVPASAAAATKRDIITIFVELWVGLGTNASSCRSQTLE
eukprot:CAMPEP_0183395098 /NCGR_PEP_ID=MMETSP0370-20130417/9068_1 /TAXON_ID=268820 /ORGANISM="Peridinium aciculiferum, Strain PAER-2" /LENGTH=56 /DNA_ID=CAMNT_0025575635 /DNA_START=45 /DNA_END=212 /DNA_ORIENTATION=-